MAAKSLPLLGMDVTKLTPQDIAQLKGLLDSVESKSKRKPRKKDKLKYLSEEQVEKFFSVMKNPRDVAMFRVMYHRGLRASEVGMIQLSDWNRERDRIRFSRLKGSNGGEYHLTSREVRCLRAWLKVRGSQAGPLFPSRESQDKGISRKMLDVLMKRYGQAAALPADLCHAHALKHSCGTHLLNRGESIEDVQDHLGHANVQNTLVYAKYSAKRREVKDQRLRDW
jgi:integrase